MATNILIPSAPKAPLAAVVAAAFAGKQVEVVVDESVQDVTIAGTKVVGDDNCAAFFFDNENVDKAKLFRDKLSSNVNEFLTEFSKFLETEKKKENTAVDAIVFACLLEKNFDLKAAKGFGAFAKWFQGVKHNKPVKVALDKVEKQFAEKTDKKKSLMGSQGRRDLKGYTEGMKVVTRFAPEPSGYLHIGHIKACLLSDFFAKSYGGEMIIRMDDTNPEKETQEFVDNIMDDLKTLGIRAVVGDDFATVVQKTNDVVEKAKQGAFATTTTSSSSSPCEKTKCCAEMPNVSFTSNYFDLLLDFARNFIKQDLAYVETLSKEEVKTLKFNKQKSPSRDRKIEESLQLFEKMVAGEGENMVLRAKIDFESDNGVMRDPAIYRTIKTPHFRTGNKYNVYPLYDFSTPIIDAIEGVTHALRSAEYHDRNALYDWMIKAANIRHVEIEDFSRLNFAYVLLSKRNLKWFVDNNIVENWNDPRFPTLQGMLRRGLTIEAMKEFCTAQGGSKAVNLMEMDKLWTVNKKIIDNYVPRFTAIEKENVFTMEISDLSAPVTKIVPRHKRNDAVGEKSITITKTLFVEFADVETIKVGEEITLMDFGNVIVDKIDAESKTMVVHTNLKGSVKDTKKLTWLPTTNTVDVLMVEYDHLITVKKITEKMKFEECVNMASKASTTLIGDPNLRTLKKGDKVQFERRGYFIVETPFFEGHPMVMNLIPDGDKNPAFRRKITMKW